MLEKFKQYFFEIKPIFITYKFELIRSKKKFIIFAIISFSIFFFNNMFPYIALQEYKLPDNINIYFQECLGFLNINGVSFIALFILLASCFFFSNIISTEYGEKTGYIIFPKIRRYQLFLGKYFGALTLVSGILALYYFLLVLGGYYFYGIVLDFHIFISYGYAILFALSVSSYVTFFSSFMKRETMTIIFSFILLLFGFTLTDLFISLVTHGEFEPIYSLAYLSNLIEYSVLKELPNPRYEELIFISGNEVISTKFWLTPTFETAIIALLIYTFLFISLALLNFKRRQL